MLPLTVHEYTSVLNVCLFLLFCGLARVCGDGSKFQFGLPKLERYAGIP